MDFSKGCSGVRQSIGKFFRIRLEFWKQCGEQVFGERVRHHSWEGGVACLPFMMQELGQSCDADSDCAAGGVCDLFAHACVATPDALTNAFLTCFVQNADPFILTYVCLFASRCSLHLFLAKKLRYFLNWISRDR